MKVPKLPENDHLATAVITGGVAAVCGVVGVFCYLFESPFPALAALAIAFVYSAVYSHISFERKYSRKDSRWY